MGSLPYDLTKHECDICGRHRPNVPIKQASWLFGTDDRICFDCFRIWCDGCTDKEKIKNYSLEGYTYWPRDND